MHHGKRVGTRILSSRIHLPFDQGGLALPDTDARTVVFGPTERLDLPGEVLHVTGFRPDHDRIVARGGRTALEAEPRSAALSIACLPRNRVDALARIARAATAAVPGGWLIVDGQKTDGADSILRRLRDVLPPEGVAARAHGKIAWIRVPDPLPAELAAWQEAAAPSRNADGYLTAPGMFSADGIDPATRLLFDYLPADAKGTAADFGAGWGALSAALLAAAPNLESCDLIEADHAALEAAKVNVTDPRARFRWADAAAWTGGPYDLIVSNPPFHAARAPDPSLGQAFITAAARCLTPRGRLLVVANRQLPYEETLARAFREVRELHADPRYKILAARQPAAAGRRGSAA